MVIGITFSSCGSLGLGGIYNSSKWNEYQIMPSKIVRNGDVFFSGKLLDNKTFTVFYDEAFNVDGTFYYNILMQDFGWYLFEDNWKSSSEYYRRPKLGYLYINPSKRVAIYMNPKKTFGAFKVSVVDKEGKEVPVKDYSIVKDNPNPLQGF
jgi:hypothetical protein